MLKVAVINVDATLFWVSQTWLVAFLRTYFSSCTVLPDSNETELGSRDQQDNSPSSRKNLRLVCSTAIHMEVCLYSLNPSYWRGMEIFNIDFIGWAIFFTDRNMDLKEDNLIQEGNMFDMTNTLLIDLQSYWLSSSCL